MDEQSKPNVDFAQLFKEVKVVAVVGYSDKPDRAGHYVSHYLLEHGYKIISINPKFGDEINGLPNYKSLGEVPQGTQVDLIDVFRAPPFVPAIEEQAAAMDPQPKYFFMQPGAESQEAFDAAIAHGMVPIMDSCMMAAHKIWV